MESEGRTAPSPLHSAALALPERATRGVALVGRLLAAAAGSVLIADQSYDGTRAFTGAIAILVLLSLAPLRGRPGLLLAALGTGLAFFSGSALLHYWQGVAMVAVSAVAGLAALAEASTRGQLALSALAFIAGAPLTGAVAVVVIAATER